MREQEELDRILAGGAPAKAEKPEEEVVQPISPPTTNKVMVIVKHVAQVPPALQVWMDIEIGASGLKSGEVVGRIVFELFYNVVLCFCLSASGLDIVHRCPAQQRTSAAFVLARRVKEGPANVSCITRVAMCTESYQASSARCTPTGLV